jgi:phosphatidate cytidylyltransferase
MTSSMARRVAVAAVGIPTALGLVRLGGWPLVAALAALAALGALELFRLAAAAGTAPLVLLGAAAAAVMPVLMYGIAQGRVSNLEWLGVGVVVWVVAPMAVAVLRRPPTQAPLGAITVTFFAPFYAGLLPSFVVLLRHAVPGRNPWTATWLVFLPLVTVWVCDSVAMAAGAVFGGPKFAPVVSPKKTWSGTIAGSVAGAVVAPLFGWLFLARTGLVVSSPRLVLFGLVVASVGQVGDLAESLLKREAGVKDSGGFFPGHGGVLDRLDSLYWALPTAAILLVLYGAV